MLGHEEVGYVEDLEPIQPSSCKCDIFVEYLLENYIDESATFPTEITASSTLSSGCIANACKSFHAKFRNNFNNPHPNIFTFMEVLKNIQIDTHIAIRSLQNLQRYITACTRKGFSTWKRCKGTFLELSDQFETLTC